MHAHSTKGRQFRTDGREALTCVDCFDRLDLHQGRRPPDRHLCPIRGRAAATTQMGTIRPSDAQGMGGERELVHRCPQVARRDAAGVGNCPVGMDVPRLRGGSHLRHIDGVRHRRDHRPAPAGIRIHQSPLHRIGERAAAVDMGRLGRGCGVRYAPDGEPSGRLFCQYRLSPEISVHGAGRNQHADFPVHHLSRRCEVGQGRRLARGQAGRRAVPDSVSSTSRARRVIPWRRAARSEHDGRSGDPFGRRSLKSGERRRGPVVWHTRTQAIRRPNPHPFAKP